MGEDTDERNLFPASPFDTWASQQGFDDDTSGRHKQMAYQQAGRPGSNQYRNFSDAEWDKVVEGFTKYGSMSVGSDAGWEHQNTGGDASPAAIRAFLEPQREAMAIMAQQDNPNDSDGEGGARTSARFGTKLSGASITSGMDAGAAEASVQKAQSGPVWRQIQNSIRYNAPNEHTGGWLGQKDHMKSTTLALMAVMGGVAAGTAMGAGEVAAEGLVAGAAEGTAVGTGVAAEGTATGAAGGFGGTAATTAPYVGAGEVAASSLAAPTAATTATTGLTAAQMGQVGSAALTASEMVGEGGEAATSMADESWGVNERQPQPDYSNYSENQPDYSGPDYQPGGGDSLYGERGLGEGYLPPEGQTGGWDWLEQIVSRNAGGLIGAGAGLFGGSQQMSGGADQQRMAQQYLAQSDPFAQSRLGARQQFDQYLQDPNAYMSSPMARMQIDEMNRAVRAKQAGAGQTWNIDNQGNVRGSGTGAVDFAGQLQNNLGKQYETVLANRALFGGSQLRPDAQFLSQFGAGTNQRAGGINQIGGAIGTIGGIVGQNWPAIRGAFGA